MKKYHKEILIEIKKKAKKRNSFIYSNAYSGTTHPRYGLNVPEQRIISKAWARQNNNISFKKFVALLDSLYTSQSVDEKKIAGQLLQYFPYFRAEINPVYIKKWLYYLEGWEEIDSMCQSVFSAQDLLANWSKWQKTMQEFARSKNIAHRRASLVFLTGPVKQSPDKRLTDLALANIEKLKHEKEILITKAISWLLREMVVHHRAEVKNYIHNNTSLPKIAVRETANKLASGIKKPITT